MSDHILNSNGYLYYASGSARFASGLLEGSARGSFEGKRMDWDKYFRSNIRADVNIISDYLEFQNGISLDHQTDDLYILSNSTDLSGAGSYQLSDVQTRNSLTYNSYAIFNPNIPLSIQLSESFSQRITDFQTNLVRSNADYINLAELRLELQANSSLSFQSRASHTYAIKDFNYNRNTRHSEFRFLNTSAFWEYLPGDSLVASYGIELQRTSYPDDDNRWDNDLLTGTLRFGNIHYWKQRIRLQTWLAWSRKEDVYIKAILSSNNKTVQSISLQPDCMVLIGDRIAFRQSYNIRADYTDYLYDGNVAGLYRQIGCKYNLVFDSFPFISRSGDPVWLALPYRNSSENAFLADIGFVYEQNEYADKIADYYSIVSKNRKYSMSLILKHDIRALYYIIEPKYTWGTWKEYSLLLGMAWQFNNQSLLEISINPTGETLRDMDWRTNLSLSLQF